MNQKIDVVVRQNPKNFTQQLQQRHTNKILANNLVKIKPMVDTKMPVSYKSKQQQQIKQQRQSQQHQQALMDNSNNVNNGTGGSLSQETGSNYAQQNQFGQDNGLIADDPLFRFSAQQEGQQQHASAMNYTSAGGAEPYGSSDNEKTNAQWRNSRGPNDSLMSQNQQQSVQTSQQHQGGGSVPQQSQAPHMHRMSRVEKQRKKQIDQDNTILLNKMIGILNRKQNKEQGLVRISKAMAVFSQHSNSNSKQARQGSAPDEADDSQFNLNNEMVPLASHYKSETSNTNFQMQQQRAQQKIQLAPKLSSKIGKNQLHLNNQQQQPFLGVSNKFMGQRSGKTSSSQQRVNAGNGFQIAHLNNPAQVHAQAQYQQATIQQEHDQSLISANGSQQRTNRGQRSQLVPMPRTPGTLNFSTRKKQIQKINQENLQMLKTLQQTKPTTSYDQWRLHAKRQQGYKNNISLAPNSAVSNNISINAGTIPNSLSQIYHKQQNNMQNFQPNIQNLTIDQLTENPVREFLRSKVKSGSLPTRANFYIHKPSSSNANSKKAYSMHNHNQNGNRVIRLSNKRTPIHSQQQRGGIVSGSGNDKIFMQHQRQMQQQQQQYPQQKEDQQPSRQINDDSLEIAQKIESVIEMFPMPTDDQLEQFKELQDESLTDMNPQSTPQLIENSQNTITNIQVYKNDNNSDHQVQNYNLDQLRSLQNHQMVSQPIVEQAMDAGSSGDAKNAYSDVRRVKTTMPGVRNRQKGQNSITVSGKHGINVDEDYNRDSPDRDPDIDMQDIQQPHSMNSMEASMNSTQHAPQIIVRRGNGHPEYDQHQQIQSQRRADGYNPMLIPMDQQQQQMQQQQQQQQIQHPMMFYPPSYQIDGAWPEGEQQHHHQQQQQHHHNQQQQQRMFYPQQMQNDEGSNRANYQQQQQREMAYQNHLQNQRMQQYHQQQFNFQQQSTDKPVVIPKRSFFDYQYQNGPDYNISFDHISKQPVVNNMDPMIMNNKLTEMQNEIAKRMSDGNTLAKQNYISMKGSMQKKNVKQIMRAYAQKNNNQIGPYGTNVSVLNHLQNNNNSRKVPLHHRKVSQQSHLQQRQTQSLHTSENANGTQVTHPTIKRKLRSNMNQQSPPSLRPNNIRNKSLLIPVISQPNRAQSKPTTVSQIKATRHRVVQQPPSTTQENNDDQVGGGPVMVSPEILRLQANRPDERQQRNRRRVISPPQSNEETASIPVVVSNERGIRLSDVTASPAPAPCASQSATATVIKFEQQQRPDNQRSSQDQNQKLEQINQQSQSSNSNSDQAPEKNINKNRSNSNADQTSPVEEKVASSPVLEQPVVASIDIMEAPVTIQDTKNTNLQQVKDSNQLQNGNQSSSSKVNTSQDQQDQRASSTIEEGIMGLKYLPQNQKPKEEKSAMEMTYGAQQIDHLNNAEDEEEVTGGQQVISSALEQNQKRHTESQKTQQAQVAGSPRVEEETKVGTRRINSTLDQHAQMPIADNVQQNNQSESKSRKAGSKQVTHQDTEVGKLVESRLVEDGLPLSVKESAELSAVTIQKAQRNEGAFFVSDRSQRPPSEDSNIISGDNTPHRSAAVRQSHGTDGMDAYSDFEDDEEQAAVGSGIVETNENSEDDYDEDAEYQDFRNQQSDSAGETSLKEKVDEEQGVPSSSQNKKEQSKPIGQIAQLVQNQLGEDEYSEISGDEESKKQQHHVATNGTQESQQPNHISDDTDEYNERQFAHTGVHHPIETGDYEDEDDQEDYEEDFDLTKTTPIDNTITKKLKMSLESDQDAPENEFEQIKDEDYVDEDDYEDDVDDERK